VPTIPFNSERRENMLSPLWRFGLPPGMNEPKAKPRLDFVQRGYECAVGVSP
jgi:hypothetical protein